MPSTKIRLSPTESATLYKVNTKMKGNDGNIWIVTENKNNVKRWKIHRKPSISNSNSNSISNSNQNKKLTDFRFRLIKIYDMPFESLYDGDVRILNKDILNNISLTKIQNVMKKYTNENLIKYYNKYPFDTNDVVENVQKSKLIFNAYSLINGTVCAEIFIKPYKSFKIPPKTITNLKKWINGQIADGFNEGGSVIDKYTLFMSFKRIK